VDPATVDCVVLTNFHNMQALPYFARRALGFDPCTHSPCAEAASAQPQASDPRERRSFDGVVLATEPTAQFGQVSRRGPGTGAAHHARALPSATAFRPLVLTHGDA
jgi:hypothetical protein